MPWLRRFVPILLAVALPPEALEERATQLRYLREDLAVYRELMQILGETPRPAVH